MSQNTLYRWSLAALWLVLYSFAATTSRTNADSPATTVIEAEHGLQQRVPWTTSNVKGIPEPPPKFQLKRAYPNIDIPNLIALNAIPDSQYLLAIDHVKDWGGPSRVYQFISDDDVIETSPFLERQEIIYGLAFHPNFSSNRYVYVGCNGKSKHLNSVATRVLRFEVTGDGPYQCEPQSETLIIEWKSDGHNGGDLAFGNDGMLYVSAGDGTSDSDRNRTGQDLSRIPGSLLRIDVDHPADGQQYSVPADNPFVETPDARGEIWAYGLRNPWRISFDQASNQLWVGNNGQDLWESVYLIEKGANYGWSIRESNHPFHTAQDSGPVEISPATAEHHHREARSLTGGHVYRGTKFPELVGCYIYGDFSTGNIWAIRHNGKAVAEHEHIARTRAQISGFGVDHDGELLIADHAGGIYELTPNDQTQNIDFPKQLSQTGLFSDVASETPAAGVIPYSVISPLWSDGALKKRWLAVPDDKTITYKPRGSWDFPDGSVLVKSFAFAEESTQSVRRIETRLMTRQEGEWYGYSYRWNEDQTDAFLVVDEGADERLDWLAGNSEGLTWRYPSRSECMVCHSRAANFVLGLSTEQLNTRQAYTSELAADQSALGQQAIRAPQLQTLAHIGMFPEGTDIEPDSENCLVEPADESVAINRRARSYLHSNCSSCHMNAGGGNAKIILTYFPKLENTHLLDALPLHGDDGIADGKLLVPGAPENSILYSRMAKRGAGQMPPIATHRVDKQAVQLIRQWIESLEPASSN